LYINLQFDTCINNSDIIKIGLASDIFKVSSGVRTARDCTIKMTAGEMSDVGKTVEQPNREFMDLTDCLYSMDLVRDYQ
jgi:hypothetical protein